MPSIGEAAQQDLALNARLSGDLQTAEIRFTIDGAQISIAAADAKVLDELIAHLGAIRSKMNPGVQNDLIPDVCTR